MESVGSSSVEGRLIGNEIKMRGDTLLKLASPSVIRRGLCMVRSPSKLPLQYETKNKSVYLRRDSTQQC